VVFQSDIISMIKNKSYELLKKNKIFTQNQIKIIISLLKNTSKIRIKRIDNEIEIKSLDFFRYLVSKKYSIDQNLIASKYDFIDYKNIKSHTKWRKKIFYDLYEKIITGKKKFLIKDFKPSR